MIIGGGVIGLSVAYHLGKAGETDVLLLERNQLTSGTSWHAAGIVGPLRASVNMTRIASYASELFPKLESETGQATGYQKTGGYWLARSEARMIELRRTAAIGELTGVDAELIAASELAAREPYLLTDDLCGALYVPSDAQANPVDICMAYAKSARTAGIALRENATVVDILVENREVRGVVLDNGDEIRCDKLVNCGGAWAHRIGEMAGAPVPLQAVEHMYVVTEAMTGIPNPFPVMRDLDAGIYIKGDTGKLVVGGFEPNAQPWNACGEDGDRAFLELPEDWEQFEPLMSAALTRLPALENAGIQHFMNGPETFTPDSRQLVGESPFIRNLFVAAGMNSTGMMSSAGIGRVMAEWVIDGEPSMDLWDIDIARFEQRHASPVHLQARMQEAVADVFSTHWPFKQAQAGRNIQQSVLHRQFEKAGAFFGAPTGWERPLWFAKIPEEQSIHYSFSEQSWWPAARRESLAMRDGVALLELSPFGKFDVQGEDAVDFLQQLCANNIDVEIGTAVYGQFLNERGGIEADVTVTRYSKNAFRVVSGAATRFRDLRWMNKQCEKLGFSAAINDVSENEAVLGVVGPQSRRLLQKVCGSGFSNAAFPFSTSRTIAIDHREVRATRVSFSGELGWELYIPIQSADAVYDAVVSQGKQFDLQHAGHLALLACSTEKGFRHWGHEIGPQETPLEAGLGFAIDWQKNGGFIGKTALLAQRKAGVEKHLLLFEIDRAHPFLMHDEPVYSGGELVGSTTSGARGFRTDKTLCMAYISCAAGMTKAELITRQYYVSVAGKKYSLVPINQCAYDPGGERMRG